MQTQIEEFESITIISPVWVFALSSPVRSFCNIAKGKVKKVDLISIHLNKEKYESVKSESEELMQAKIKNYQSLVCRFGGIKEYAAKYARLWQTMKPETPVEAAILENCR